MILAGDLPAGAKLNEATIADLLGVSRGPVREAFRALEESGLVRLEKNRGVFVRQIDVKEADEIYELRAVLDEFVGRRVSQTAKDHDILEKIAGRQAAAAGRALFEHVMGSRERMHQATGDRSIAAKAAHKKSR